MLLTADWHVLTGRGCGHGVGTITGSREHRWVLGGAAGEPDNGATKYDEL